MTRKNRTEAEELFDQRNAPDEWDDSPERIETKPSGSQVVSFRLPDDEFLELTDALTRTEEKLSEYVRKALMLRLRGTPIGPAVELTTGASRLTVRSVIVTDQRRNAPLSFVVEDFPPLKASL